MLIIKTVFNAVVLQNEEFAIYTNEYPADKDGNPLQEDDPRLKKLQYYEYGDLIIETVNKKYIFKKIYSAYQVVAELIEKISEMKKASDTLTIDIGALAGHSAEDPDTFDLEVREK